jgi:hypothetical protein
VAARKHVEGTASAVKPEFVALLCVHVRVLVQTMMVETISDTVIEITVVFYVIAVFLLC